MGEISIPSKMRRILCNVFLCVWCKSMASVHLFQPLSILSGLDKN